MDGLHNRSASTSISTKSQSFNKVFKKTTLGPISNFDIVHWLCNYQPGMANLYDSLYDDIIEEQVEEQVGSLTADSYIGIVNVLVQQQQNGSDLGVLQPASVR